MDTGYGEIKAEQEADPRREARVQYWARLLRGAFLQYSPVQDNPRIPRRRRGIKLRREFSPIWEF